MILSCLVQNLFIDQNLITYELELIINDTINSKIPILKNTDIFTWALFKKNAKRYITIDYNENKIIGCYFKTRFIRMNAKNIFYQ